jgi:formylglycine-generating enzyme required for sulfatase activity
MINTRLLGEGHKVGSARSLFRAIFLLSLFITLAQAQVPLTAVSLPSFRDCADCPEMVVLPAGSFLMGANEEASLNADIPKYAIQFELPQHSVSIKSFALAKYDVTKGEFAKFVRETGYDLTGCETYDGNTWRIRQEASWREPGFDQTDQDPVVCVSLNDAMLYVYWLNGKLMDRTVKKKSAEFRFRLPSEAEWEYAARAGTKTLRFWGDDATNQCKFANGRDLTAKDRFPNPNWTAATCRDGFITTSPAGAFRPNQWGLYDMLGNVRQWVEDCWHYNYSGAPSDGQAWIAGACAQRVVRGGGWATIPRGLTSTNRVRFDSSSRQSNLGFRLARDVQR